jgi:hypothetical protein
MGIQTNATAPGVSVLLMDFDRIDSALLGTLADRLFPRWRSNAPGRVETDRQPVDDAAERSGARLAQSQG